MTRSLKTVLLVLVVAAAAFLAVFLPASSASAATDIDYGTWSSALERNKVTVRPSSSTSLLGNCVGTNCRAGWYTQQANKTWQIRTVPATAPVQNPGTVLPNVKPATPGVAAPKLGARIVGGAAQAALVVSGVDMIYSGAGAITHALVGTTSQGLQCDFLAIFNSVGCAVAPAPDYVINSDISFSPPGWYYGTNVAETHTVDPPFGKPYLSAAVDVLAAPLGGESYSNRAITLEITLGASGTETRPKSDYLVRVIPLFRGPDGVLDRIGNQRQVRVAPGNTLTTTIDLPYDATGRTFAGVLAVVEPLDQNDIGLISQLGESNLISRGETVTGTFIRWHPEGDPQFVPGTASNPWRRFITTSHCIGSAGGYQEIGLSELFYETDPEWPGLPTPDCGQDEMQSWKIEQETEGLGTQTIYEWELDPELQQALADLPVEQLSGDLQLDLFRLDDTYEVSCFQHPELCVDWFDDPARADNFVCRYGGEVVPLTECFIYRPTFSYAKAKQGINHADEEGNLPDPSAEPVTPDQNNTCPPPFQWSSLVNPWYYYKSFSCTLTEMFVPTQSPQTRVQTTYATLQDSAIGTIGRFFPLIPPLFDIGPNRCGLLVDVELPTLNPLGASGNRVQVDTCDGIWAEADPIRAILGAAFIISGAFFALRIILKTIRVESVSEPAS